jgi:hypothetical protein
MDALTESKYVPGSPIYTAVYIQERPGTLSRGEQTVLKGYGHCRDAVNSKGISIRIHIHCV